MAYIWNDYSSGKRYRVSSEGTSPYLEVWDTAGDVVLVNLDLRLFETLIPRHCMDSEERINELMVLYETDARYQDMANTFLHFLARQDRMRGMTLQDFHACHAWTEIMLGYYGAEVKECFESLTCEDRFVLCGYLAKYERTKGREMQLDAVIRALFHEVVICHERSADMIHVRIHRERSDYNSRLFELVCRFFKDIDIQVRVYWQKEYFGIIGADDTMRIDSLVLI